MTEKLSFVLGVARMTEKIEVVYFDGEPIVYKDDNRLNEKEIVDLLVEYFEDCDALIKENEQLKSNLGYWRTLAKNLAKENNVVKVGMMDNLNKWIEKKMDYYERIIEKTEGSNYVNARGHLDMLIVLKEWIEQR